MTKREHEMMTVEGGGNNDVEEINTNDDDHDDEEEATPTNKNGNKKFSTKFRVKEFKLFNQKPKEQFV